MHKFHFSLASLFASIIVVAVGCAALARPTELWTATAISMSVGLLLAALVKVVYCPRARRAFWVGFAIVGWGYLLMDRVVMQFPSAGDADQLLTARLLRTLARATLGNDPVLGYYSAPGAFPVPVESYSSVSPTPTTIMPSSDMPVPSPAVSEAEAPMSPMQPDGSPTTFEPADNGAAAIVSEGPAPAAYSSPQPFGAVLTTSGADPGDWQRFMLLGRYLWALALGLGGGLLASYFQSRASQVEPKHEIASKPAA